MSELSLKMAFETLLRSYSASRDEPYAKHEVAALVRTKIPSIIKKSIKLDGGYKVFGSAGQGAWALSPWVAIFDLLITDSAQKGFYIVYLFREDLSGVYLSLNQGVTEAREQYGSNAKIALKARAGNFLARMGKLEPGVEAGEIDLAASREDNLSSYYETSNICSKFYSLNQMPDDEVLIKDIKLFLRLYKKLTLSEQGLFEAADSEEDEVFLAKEGLKKLRIHKRIERNRKLSDKAKKHHGYICKACGFDFEAIYGDIGKGFIEAHHLKPLSSLDGDERYLSPIDDFTVLCSNCHRMIHKTEHVGYVEGFAAAYLKK